jgi:hypothetical protein
VERKLHPLQESRGPQQPAPDQEEKQPEQGYAEDGEVPDVRIAARAAALWILRRPAAGI